MNRDYERTMNRNYERTMNDRMIERTNDRNFGSITTGKRLFRQTNGRTIERPDERTNEPWTIGRTIERSNERTNKLRTGGRTIKKQPNDPCASVCLCGTWNGCVWGGGEESCHEMAWVGWEEALVPLFIAMEGRLGEGMRGLVGD
jgi:hypothetical protein